MLTVLPRAATTKKFVRRSLIALHSQMSQAQNANESQNGTHRKPVSIPFSSRLVEGRALAQDVWSIFKYVPLPHFLPIH
jgi:hypothetical protein